MTGRKIFCNERIISERYVSEINDSPFYRDVIKEYYGSRAKRAMENDKEITGFLFAKTLGEIIEVTKALG